VRAYEKTWRKTAAAAWRKQNKHGVYHYNGGISISIVKAWRRAAAAARHQAGAVKNRMTAAS